MGSRLENELERSFSGMHRSDSLYTSSLFGGFLGIEETDHQIHIINKDDIIRSYPNTQTGIKQLCEILDDSVVVFNSRLHTMYALIGYSKVTWLVTNPFGAGALYVDHRGHGKDRSVNKYLTADEVAEILFEEFPQQPFVNFRIDGMSFLYVNKKQQL